MDGEQLTQEEALQLWNEEAAKLNAGDEPAELSEAAAPLEDAPQEPVEPEVQEQSSAPEEQPSTSQASLPPEVLAALAEVNELKQANAQLLHHIKSADGRMAAIQREFQQAREAQQAVAPEQAPTQGQMTAAAKNPEKWEQLKQDFPEWASAMEEYVASKLGSAQRAQQPSLTAEQVAGYVQQQVAQTRAEMARALEEARIEGKYDNWRGLVNTTEFAQWFAVQPPEVRVLAESPAARDAIRMLDLFSEAKKRSASDIRQERGQRLAAAATTRPGQTPPPKTLDDMSAQELWNYEARKREKERAQRGY